MHYYRVRKTGHVGEAQPAHMVGGTAPDYLRFVGWDETESRCWEWRGAKQPNGYGISRRFTTRTRLAHRLAYETWVGPIPRGLIVRHKCDNPPCINPDHLETGTRAENTGDMIERGRDRLVGERNHQAKLTLQEVADIREECAKGILPQHLIGEVYGITQSGVSAIVRGRVWG